MPSRMTSVFEDRLNWRGSDVTSLHHRRVLTTASIHRLATAEHSVSLPPRNLVTVEQLATACDDLGCLESAGTHGSLPGL